MASSLMLPVGDLVTLPGNKGRRQGVLSMLPLPVPHHHSRAGKASRRGRSITPLVGSTAGFIQLGGRCTGSTWLRNCTRQEGETQPLAVVLMRGGGEREGGRVIEASFSKLAHRYYPPNPQSRLMYGRDGRRNGLRESCTMLLDLTNLQAEATHR